MAHQSVAATIINLSMETLTYIPSQSHHDHGEAPNPDPNIISPMSAAYCYSESATFDWDGTQVKLVYQSSAGQQLSFSWWVPGTFSSDLTQYDASPTYDPKAITPLNQLLSVTHTTDTGAHSHSSNVSPIFIVYPTPKIAQLPYATI